jgi:hypothetical protein
MAATVRFGFSGVRLSHKMVAQVRSWSSVTRAEPAIP